MTNGQGNRRFNYKQRHFGGQLTLATLGHTFLGAGEGVAIGEELEVAASAER